LGAVCALVAALGDLPSPTDKVVRAALFAIAAVGFVAVVIRWLPLPRQTDGTDRRRWWVDVYVTSVRRWQSYGTPRIWLRATCLSLLCDVTSALNVYCILKAVDVTAGLALSFVTVLFLRGIRLVPAAPAHIGVQEVGMTAALLAFGVPQDAALAAALLYHLSHLLPVLLTAGLLTALPGTTRPVAP
jgi:hypothetical protein